MGPWPLLPVGFVRIMRLKNSWGIMISTRRFVENVYGYSKQMAPKLNNVSNLLNVRTAALLATTSKKFKNEYERRLKGINERKKVVTAQAAQAGKLRKKEAIERLFNELVLRHGNIPSQVNYNVNQMINVYKYLNGDRLNIIELLKIRRDQQALMRKLRKARERFNKKIQKEINNMVRSQGSTPNYNTSGWN
jgi:hypothetical protein